MAVSKKIALVGLWTIAVAVAAGNALATQERTTTPTEPVPSSRPLVFNAGFDEDQNGDGVPDGWTTAGRRGVVQTLRIVDDPQRGKVARLECTQFESGFPDSHAMLAQVGQVGLRRGQWYRLRLWAKAERLQTGEVQVAIANRRTWQETGCRDAFTPSSTWELVEIHFQATSELAPEDSRLQIWLSGTGVLYLDDVELQPVDAFRPERLPQVPWVNPRNALPNSSFELGPAGWGSFAPRLSGWGSQLFFRHAFVDDSRSKHGGKSLKVTLDLDAPFVSYFDYFDPRAEVVDCLVVASEGWIPVRPGNRYLLACWAMAEEADTPVLVSVQQADGRRIERRFTVGKEWTQLVFSFTAERESIWIGVGPDLRGTPRRRATLWLDALQLAEQGSTTPAEISYEPRRALEWAVSVRSGASAFGEFIFRAGEISPSIQVDAYNADSSPHVVRGKIWVTDFRDRIIWERTIEETIPPQQVAALTFPDVFQGRRGFYRVHMAEEGSQHYRTLRLALVDPFPADKDSSFGMNHAFGWSELLRIAHVAGIRWWRDWSTQWRLVQKAEADRFDFAIPKVQIDRVLAADGKVVMLLPFPGTPWAVEANMEKIRAEAGANRYLAERLVIAQKPRNPALFARYVEESVKNFWPAVDTIEILNEPLFTSYAVPASYGHTMADYLELLAAAYKAAKSVSPQVRVVGGIAAPPDHRFVREFLQAGGPRWCDVVNLHLYP
ncbi:MAG: hypothetical protein RMJ16_15360, partial [Thermoguttaceae bacterium]|nr:hypothetical protein [Thermoguttaceae bacterium]